MRRAALLLACVLGCSSGGGEPALTAPQIAVLDCARIVVLDWTRILGEMERLLVAATGGPSDGVALQPNGDYTITMDADADGVPDTTVSGTATFPQDPATGIPTGEEIPITFRLDPIATATPLEGSGTLRLTFENPSRAQLRGGGSLRNEGGCAASLLLLESLPQRVTFTTAIAGPAPTVEALGLVLSGPIDATVTTPREDTFNGTLELDGDTQAMLVDGNIDGEDFRTVIELFPDAVQVRGLVDCGTRVFALYDDLFGILLALSQQIASVNGDVEALPTIPGVTVTPVSGSNATYSIDLTRLGTLFTAGTITGSVRTTRVNLEVTSRWSWRLNGAMSGEESVFGNSARFFAIAIPNAGGSRATGEGTLGRPNCVGSFDIPESDPVRDEGQLGGNLTVRAVVGPHALETDFTYVAGTAVPRQFRINNVPVPAGSLPE
ncbi:MAG: hypothetical protein AAGD14_00155 [Planctomycetota bacterium]